MSDTILIPTDLERATAAIFGEIPLGDVPSERVPRPSNVVALPTHPTLAARADAPFVVLGCADERYVFMTGLDGETAGSLRAIGASGLTKNTLLELATLDWWLGAFPKPRERDDEPPRVAWDRAIDYVLQQGAKRHFDPKRVRGRGTWLDRGHVVIHAGDKLIVDGNVIDIREQAQAELQYLYVSRPPVDHGRNAEPLDVAGAERMIAAIRRFSWKRQRDADTLAGWLFCAAMCGALKWRPHAWLTARAGSGKSELYTRVITKVLAAVGGTKVAGDSSEAGIRQSLGGDAFAVMLDEAEPGADQSDKKRMARILALARLAASDDAPAILRGSSNGTALSYSIRSMFLWSSIEPTIVNDADASRIALLELVPPPSGKEAQAAWREALVEIDAAFSADNCAAFAARARRLAPTMIVTADRFRLASAMQLNSGRAGDVYGVLAAGFWHLTHDETPDLDTAAAFLDEIGYGQEMLPVAGADGDHLIARLFQLPLEFAHLESVDGENSRRVRRYTLAGLLDEIWHDKLPTPDVETAWTDMREAAYEALRQAGIRFADQNNAVVPIEKWRSSFSQYSALRHGAQSPDHVTAWKLLVARRHPVLDAHFAEASCGATGYALQLERSGVSFPTPVRFGGVPTGSRAIALPLDLARD